MIVSGPMPPPMGGMETYCLDYMRTSLPRQFDVTMCRSILLKRGRPAPSILRVPLRGLNSLVIAAVWLAMLIWKRPDVAHVHTCSYAGFYVRGLLALLARLLGARSILHIHGAEFKQFYGNASPGLQRLIRWQISSNDAVIVLSKEWRMFFESIGISPDRLVVMTNCVFTSEIPPRAENAGKISVLYLSRLQRRKGVYELVEAVHCEPQLQRTCHVVLAGPKTHAWAQIAEQVRKAGLEGVIDMPGPKTGEEKHKAYLAADVYVLQSFNEGMPIGLLEAMSYGLACVTTPVGGIPDVVQDGRNGLLIPPGDAYALIRALKRLVAEPQLRAELGRQARWTVQERFNWDARAQEIGRLYRRLASGRPSVR